MGNARYSAVVIGASAGALDALSAILPALPKDYPLPILIVVHLPPERNSALPELMQAKCKLDVREAEDKEPILPGRVYIAPPDYHLLVEPDRRISLSSDEPVMFSRPSIDVLFESAADAYPDGDLIGIVLSGANYDGAKGLKAICATGGTAWVQNPATAQASTMPESALKACSEAKSLELLQIVAHLKDAAAL